jgi:hypothetical protein
MFTSEIIDGAARLAGDQAGFDQNTDMAVGLAVTDCTTTPAPGVTFEVELNPPPKVFYFGNNGDPDPGLMATLNAGIAAVIVHGANDGEMLVVRGVLGDTLLGTTSITLRRGYINYGVITPRPTP